MSSNDSNSSSESLDIDNHFDPDDEYQIKETIVEDINIAAIDYQIDTLTKSCLETKDNINYNNSIQEKVQLHFMDFRKHQQIVCKQLLHLPVNNSTITSIKLLKIMLDGHIPSCHYSTIIKWHNETMQLSHNIDCRTQLTMIKSKKKVLSLLHDIMYNYVSPLLSFKPIHNVITLPSNISTKISKMNLMSSLFSLLTDPELFDDSNIYISMIEVILIHIINNQTHIKIFTIVRHLNKHIKTFVLHPMTFWFQSYHL